MKVRIAQLVISKNIQENISKIHMVLEHSSINEWVLFPEGMISGYYPEEADFLNKIDPNCIVNNINLIQKITVKKKIHCLIGSVLKSNNNWYNSVIFMSSKETLQYNKNNLSTLDRNHFIEGNELKTYQTNDVCFGIQMCRELVFPEQWKILKKQGAQVIFHINNAIRETDKVRENILISRAFENQVWVCSVNNATHPQVMSSMIIDPYGKIIWQSTPQKEEIYTQDLDLSIDSNEYLKQERVDLVELISKGKS